MPSLQCKRAAASRQARVDGSEKGSAGVVLLRDGLSKASPAPSRTQPVLLSHHLALPQVADLLAATGRARAGFRRCARPAAARHGAVRAALPSSGRPARVWRRRPATGWSLSSKISLASTCGCSITLLRVKAGAQGTSAASRRAIHSAVVRVFSTSWIRARRALMFWSRNAGVLKRGSSTYSGPLEGAAQIGPFLVAHVATVMCPSLVS